MLMHPGPGVDGPGPGVSMYQPGAPGRAMTSQIAFVGPEGMNVTWDVGAAGAFDSPPLVCPSRYNFPQGAIYRLKLSSIPGRPGVELYPTLEVGPVMPRTEAFLAHNAIPVQFTPEDFDQVLSGNFVTKVIYLPDPEYQELALAGVETLVSTRLDPGVDPIVEADRRGAILAIVRLGNKDLQAAGGQSIGRRRGHGVVSVSPGGGNRRRIADADGQQGGRNLDDADELHGRRHGTAVRDADVRHADWLARPACRAAGSARRLAEARRQKPHPRPLPKPTEKVKVDVKQTPGLQLSEAGRSRPHRRTHAMPEWAGSINLWATARKRQAELRAAKREAVPE